MVVVRQKDYYYDLLNGRSYKDEQLYLELQQAFENVISKLNCFSQVDCYWCSGWWYKTFYFSTRNGNNFRKCWFEWWWISNKQITIFNWYWLTICKNTGLLSALLPLFVYIAFFGHVIISMGRFNRDRKFKLKEGMTMMGLYNGSYWSAMFLSEALFSIVSTLLVTAFAYLSGFIVMLLYN